MCYECTVYEKVASRGRAHGERASRPGQGERSLYCRSIFPTSQAKLARVALLKAYYCPSTGSPGSTYYGQLRDCRLVIGTSQEYPCRAEVFNSFVFQMCLSNL